MGPINNYFKPSLELTGKVVNDVDGLSKVSGFVIAVLATVGAFFKNENTQLVVGALTVPAKSLKDMIGGLGVIERVYEFTDSSKIDEYMKSTLPKKINKIATTIGQSLETASYFASLSVINLGSLAANVAGKLPLIALAKNVSFVAASSFSIYESGKALWNNKATRSEERKKVLEDEHDNAKLDKMMDARIAKRKSIKDENNNSLLFKDAKVQRYKAKIEIQTREKNKQLINVAAEVTKIAVITLGTIAAAFMVTASAFVMTTLALGLASASIQLGKVYFTKWTEENKPKALPEI